MSKKKEKTNPQQLEQIAEEFCDHYCKYPEQYPDTEEGFEALCKICDSCPMMKVI